MSVHRIPLADLDGALRAIVRGGEHIDSVTSDGDEVVVITEDRIETRPARGFPLDAAWIDAGACANFGPWSDRHGLGRPDGGAA